jgi:hypothetical protein
MEYQVAISPLAVRKVNPGERLTLQGAITAAGLGYHHSDAPVDASGGSGDISNMQCKLRVLDQRVRRTAQEISYLPQRIGSSRRQQHSTVATGLADQSSQKT